ncbi:MAG: ParB/Srx family N-terminal domain-containing protein [Prosthecobacter sp.]
MNLNRVFATQKRLRNPAQLPALVEAVGHGAPFPPVLLAELEDGTVYIQDGHHRCLAFVLAGRTSLNWGEYVLLPVDHLRPLRGKLMDQEVIERLLDS